MKVNDKEEVWKFGFTRFSDVQAAQCMFWKPILRIPDELPPPSARCPRPGFAIELATVLCARLGRLSSNISCEFAWRPDGTIGTAAENGQTGTGLVGDLMNGSIDVSYLTYSPARTRGVQFTPAVEERTIMAVAKFPMDQNPTETSPFGLTTVYDRRSWAFIIGCLCLMTLVTFFFRKLASFLSSISNEGQAENRPTNLSLVWQIFSEYVINLTGNSWGASFEGGLWPTSVTQLMLTWKLTSLVVISVYSSGILAAFLVVNRKFPFTDMPSLARCFGSRRCQPIFRNLNSILYTSVTDTDRFPLVAHAINSINHQVASYGSRSSIQGVLKRLKTPKRPILVEFDYTSFLLSQLVKDARRSQLCRLMVVRTGIEPTYPSFAVRRNDSRRHAVISRIVGDFDRVGILAKLRRDYAASQFIVDSYSSTCYSKAVTTLHRAAPIRLNRFYGLGTVCAVSFVVAMLTCAWELRTVPSTNDSRQGVGMKRIKFREVQSSATGSSRKQTIESIAQQLESFSDTDIAHFQAYLNDYANEKSPA